MLRIAGDEEGVVVGYEGDEMGETVLGGCGRVGRRVYRGYAWLGAGEEGV